MQLVEINKLSGNLKRTLTSSQASLEENEKKIKLPDHITQKFN